MKHIFTILLFSLFAWTLSAQSSWNSLGSEIAGNNLKIYGLSAPDEQNIWAVTRNFLNDQGVQSYTRSTNGGSSWDPDTIPVPHGSKLTSVHVFALNAQTAWVSMEKFDTRDSAVIYKTTDGGSTWNALTGAFTAEGRGLKALYFWDANEGIAFGSAGTLDDNQNELRFFTSNDGGSTWTEVANAPAKEGTWTASGTQGFAVVENTVWVGSTAGNIWKSEDKGQSWTSASTGLGTNISSVAFKDANNGVCVTEDRTGAFTSDGGSTWTTISGFSTAIGALQPTNVLYIPKTENTYIAFNAPFNNSDIAYSNDGGQTWASFNALLSMESMVFFSLNEGYGGTTISSSTQGGIYEWTGSIPGAVNNETLFPETSLPSIYPNPSQGRVHIEQKIQGPWSYKVFDLGGNLVRGDEDIQQSYRVLDFSGLSGGVYLIEILQSERRYQQRLIIR